MSKNTKEEIFEIPTSAIYKIESYIDSMKNVLDDLKASLRPQLRFDAIKDRLSPTIIERIFREFACKIKADDEIKKTGTRISKGSLNMSLTSGIWNRFSDSASGDIFSFVAAAEGISEKEALKIVASFMGIKQFNGSFVHSISPSREEELKTDTLQKGSAALSQEPSTLKEEWIPYDVLPSDVPLFVPERILPKGVILEGIYEYKNKFGQLLGYTIRIHNKLEDKKQVLPVAYCKNEVKGQSRWQLKGFLDNGCKPIYRAEVLSKNLLNPVLIVEGEKTANAAAKLFPDFSVISWLGGAQVIRKVGWNQIKGREVIIWPDNDVPGMLAARAIKEELGRINGVFSAANIIDVAMLNLPPKWDLADDMPAHLSKQKLNLIISECFKIGQGMVGA